MRSFIGRHRQPWPRLTTRGWVVLAITLFIISALLGFFSLDPNPKSLRTPVIISDDDPRWDCNSMGNRICGPGAPVRI